MRLFILLALFWVYLGAQNIESLLKAYELASDLSNRTKEESAGNLVIYTRDDLQRMQARTLKDILKSFRFYHYAENRAGNPDIRNEDPIIYNSMPIRIYLNDTELISAVFGSGTFWFGDMELDFIDHIEIYQSFPSFDIGIEPASLVVRLYSKDVEHDRGGRIKIGGGSFDSNAQNLYYTESSGGVNYFVYAGRYDDLGDTYPLEDRLLSRDRKRRNLFASFQKGAHRLELFGMQQESDQFLGWAIAGAPKRAESEVDYYSLSLHSAFFDRSLELDISYSGANTSLYNGYTQNVLIFSTFKNYEQSNKENTLTVNMKKTWELENHKLITGLQYRRKSFSLENLTFNGQSYPSLLSFDTQDIYSVYLQDDYTLDDHQMLTLSLMKQQYRLDNDAYEDFSPLLLRAGYIYTDDRWYAKSFFTTQEFPPELYMLLQNYPDYYILLQSYQGNPDLQPMSAQTFTQEFGYNWENSSARLLLELSRRDDTPYYDGSVMQNSDLTVDLDRESIELTFRMRETDKINLELFRTSRTSPADGTENTYYGGLFRMINTFGAFDLFNEVVMRDGYGDETSYDYSAGIRYHATDDFTIDIKGENLLDEGLQWHYIYDTYPESKYITVPTIEQRIWVGLEYLF